MQPSASAPLNDLDRDGFVIRPGVLSETELETLSRSLGILSSAGTRAVLSSRAILDFAKSERVGALLSQYFDRPPLPVRGIYFDKRAEANWSVAWHQDLTITVEERINVPGFGPWSIKDGRLHVQPPTEILEQMVTVRVHLDAADEGNGALKVIPGSHLKGKLPAEQILSCRSQQKEFLCCALAGDVLLMRPLLLHSSSRSSSGKRRRVLHIEYAGSQLPGGLQWQRW